MPPAPPSPDLALVDAAWDGDAECSKKQAVLDLGDVVDREARDEGGWTAFLCACNIGSAECINVLTEAGCDKAAVTDRGATALMEAAWSGEAAAVRAVLGLGVKDKDARAEDDGATAFLPGMCLLQRVGGVHRIACEGGVRQGRCVRYRTNGADARGCVKKGVRGAGGSGSGRGGSGDAGR